MVEMAHIMMMKAAEESEERERGMAGRANDVTKAGEWRRRVCARHRCARASCAP